MYLQSKSPTRVRINHIVTTIYLLLVAYAGSCAKVDPYCHVCNKYHIQESYTTTKDYDQRERGRENANEIFKGTIGKLISSTSKTKTVKKKGLAMEGPEIITLLLQQH